MAQGDLMLGLIAPRPVSLVGLPIVKVPGGQKDHIHTDRGHGVACRGTIHHKSSGLGGDRSKIIAHHKGIISIVQGAIYILDHIAFFIRSCNRLPIFIPLISSNTLPSARECKVMVCPLKIRPGACGARVISGFKYLSICSFN